MSFVKNGRGQKQKYFEMVGFDQLQHRVTDSRTGEPKSLPWIKLYWRLLDEPAFEGLPDQSKFHYIGLLLLARRLGNKLPFDPEYLSRKLSATYPVDLEILLEKRLIAICKRNRIKADEYAPSTHPKRPANAQDEKRLEERRQDTDKTTGDVGAVLALAGGVGVNKDYSKSDSPQLVASTVENGSQESVAVRGSRFDISTCRRYVEYCRSQGQMVRSTEALTLSLHKSGEADQLIQEFLTPPPTIEARAKMARQPDPNCELCSGSGSTAGGLPCVCRQCVVCAGTGCEVVPGRGARPCICRRVA
jgi:hypothetical protein